MTLTQFTIIAIVGMAMLTFAIINSGNNDKEE